MNMFKRHMVLLYEILVVVLMIFSVVLTHSDNVFAEDSTSISIATAPLLEWEIEPGSFETIDLPYQVTTDNYYGYSVTLTTTSNTTDLINEEDENKHIPTITLPVGTRMVNGTQINNGYGYSLDGINFMPVPSVGGEGDLVADTGSSTPNEPQTHTIKFGAKVDESTSPGVYDNTFLLTAIANDPITCEARKICYVKNGATSGTLEEQSVTNNANVILSTPDYSRPGYGFAGWNTRIDGHGTNYGPNETISVGNVSNSGLILFAKWIPSSGTMQNFNGCDAMNVGDVIALTDNRDGNVYTIAKQVDGACWMTENLKLDFSNPDVTISTQNTNNPTPEFVAAVNAHPVSSSQFCTAENSNCFNQVLFNTDETDMNGNYYNWYTATAGHGLYSTKSTNVTVAGDVCPIGWRLPTGVGSAGDLATLDVAIGGTGINTSTEIASNRWRKYPLNFTLSGQYNGGAITDVGTSGNYHSSNPTNNQRMANLWLLTNKVNMNSNGSLKSRGQSVRCMRKDYYTVHFEKNNDAQIDGTMEDQAVTRDANVALKQNEFSHTYANHLWYRFSGWNTKADGSGTSYEDSQKVFNLAERNQTITLYAQWEEVHYADVTVLFDQDAVSRISFDNGVYGGQAVFFDEEVIPLAIGKQYDISFWLNSGYVFIHWGAFENAELGDEYDEVTTLTISGDVILALGTNTGEDDHLHMQNLNPASCTTTPKLAYDLRDGEAYYIQRLADGKCWMIDDLRLGSHEMIREINSSNTNIATGTVLDVVTTSTVVDSYTEPQINTMYAHDSTTSFGNSSGKAGVLYNFCAASAGTVCSEESAETPTYDICPSGWSMPTGGNNNNTSDFKKLANQFSTVADLQVGASLTFSGWYDNRTLHGIAEYGTATYLWSKTPSNATNKSYVMIVGNTKKTLDKGYFENYGMAMRCILTE